MTLEAMICDAPGSAGRHDWRLAVSPGYARGRSWDHPTYWWYCTKCRKVEKAELEK